MHRQVKRLAILAVALGLPALYPLEARAGDKAERTILGFSPDGKVFAFEQYGVEDGSGFPYAEIVVIDTEKDEWLPGTPFRQRLETDGAKVEDARKAVAEEARALLARRRVGEPGETLFSDLNAVATGRKQQLEITPPGWPAPFTLELEERVFASAECKTVTDAPVKGFTLRLDLMHGRSFPHRDDGLPAHRGCPLAYAVTDVLSYEKGDWPAFAVIIRMQKHGFEGPDTRYLAVGWR